MNIGDMVIVVNGFAQELTNDNWFIEFCPELLKYYCKDRLDTWSKSPFFIVRKYDDLCAIQRPNTKEIYLIHMHGLSLHFELYDLVTVNTSEDNYIYKNAFNFMRVTAPEFLKYYTENGDILEGNYRIEKIITHGIPAYVIRKTGDTAVRLVRGKALSRVPKPKKIKKSIRGYTYVL